MLKLIILGEKCTCELRLFLVPCDQSFQDQCGGDASCISEPSSLVFPHWDYVLKGLRENEYTCKSLHLNENSILLLSSYYNIVIDFKMNIEPCACLLLIDLSIELRKC